MKISDKNNVLLSNMEISNKARTSHISLVELQQLIGQRLNDGFALPLWVSAEVSELKVNYSGHCYMELVEKGLDNQVPRAKISAVVWRSAWGAIAGYFVSATGGDLSVGMKVLVRATVTYHQLYGLSLQITDIDPNYTLGDMQRERQQTIDRLITEGVYDMNRELEMPMVVQRLAVISSRNAAGFQDFIKEIESSPYHFDIQLFDSFMQGNGAEGAIIDALEQIAQRMDSFDAVVVIRGGGSQSDLACFNSYRLTSHLAQFPLPIITGIGHDKDQSVADLVAAVELKTPTAVAGYLIDQVSEFDAFLDSNIQQINQSIKSIIDPQAAVIQRLGFSTSQLVDRLSRTIEMQVQKLGGELVARSARGLAARAERATRAYGSLGEVVLRRLQEQSTQHTIAQAVIDGYRPERILGMGFAIVRSGGRVVKESAQLSTGDKVEITLSNGVVEAKVEANR